MKKKIITLIITLIAFAKDCNILPTYLNIFLHLLICFISVCSDIIVYCYYGSLPDCKKSLLTYIVRLMSVVSGVTVLWFNMSAIAVEFPAYTGQLLLAYPNLFCSLLRSETFSEVIIFSVALVQLCKAFIVSKTFFFLNMNHERVFKYILAGVVAIFVIQNGSALIFTKTLCTDTKIKRLLQVQKIDLPKEVINQAPPLFLVHVLFAVISTLLLKFIKWKKLTNRVSPNAGMSQPVPKQLADPILQDDNIFTISKSNSLNYTFSKIEKNKVGPSNIDLDKKCDKDNESANTQELFLPIEIIENNENLDNDGEIEEAVNTHQCLDIPEVPVPLTSFTSGMMEYFKLAASEVVQNPGIIL